MSAVQDQMRLELGLCSADAELFPRQGISVDPADAWNLPDGKPQPNGKLRTALVRAWRWQKLIEAGKYASVREAARAEGVAKSYAAKISKMMLLAPDIVDAIIEGRTDDRVMLKVLDGPLPVDWEEQRALLGIG